MPATRAVGVALLLAACGQPAGSRGPSKAVNGEMAPARDRTLRLRKADSWNRHWADAAGADHMDQVGAVSLTLEADGHSRAVDRGTRSESVLDGDWYRENKSQWSTSWRGTWTLAGRTLRLELDRGEHVCRKTEIERRGAHEQVPRETSCPEGPRHLAIACEEEVVDAYPAASDPAADARSTAAWACSPAGDQGEVTGTPFRWVFGKERCLEASGGGVGSVGIRYTTCAE